MGELFERSTFAALALRLHFLLEAARLELLPSSFARIVQQLAGAAEDDGPLLPHVKQAERAFLNCCDALGLAGIGWPGVDPRRVPDAVRLAVDHAGGGRIPRLAAERLGRFCEELANERRDRRRRGRYYTPPWVADMIARALVRGVLAGRRSRPEAALSLRALDPAAGGGVFGVAMVEAIADAVGEEERGNAARRAAASECTYLMDLDPLAAEASRLSVWLAASRPGRPAVVPAAHVWARDALAHPPDGRSFDLIMGNPPWGIVLPLGKASGLARSAPGALSGHRDSCLFFLHLAAEAARDEGGIGMILPDVLLWQIRYEGMRRWLLDRFRPAQVALLGERVFPGATAPACALCLMGRDLAPRRLLVSDLRDGRPKPAVRRRWTAMSNSPLSAPHASFVPAPAWQAALLARLRKAHPTLGELAHRFRLHDVGVNYPRAELGRAVLYSGEQRDGRDIQVVRGRDFGPLTPVTASRSRTCPTRTAGVWLRHDWRRRAARGSGLAVREDVYRMSPKLLLRQTGDRPVATVDREGVHFGRSVIAIAAESERDLLWLAALLNSTTFAALYQALTPEAGRVFAQVKVNKLKLVPLPVTGEERRLADVAARLMEEVDGARRAALIARLNRLAALAYGLRELEITRVERLFAISAGGGRPKPPQRAGTW